MIDMTTTFHQPPAPIDSGRAVLLWFQEPPCKGAIVMCVNRPPAPANPVPPHARRFDTMAEAIAEVERRRRWVTLCLGSPAHGYSLRMHVDGQAGLEQAAEALLQLADGNDPTDVAGVHYLSSDVENVRIIGDHCDLVLRVKAQVCIGRAADALIDLSALVELQPPAAVAVGPDEPVPYTLTEDSP